MRPHVLQCIFLCALVSGGSAFGIDLIMGPLMGLTKGVISGSLGAFTPLAKEGLGSLLDMFTGGLGGAASEAGNVANQGMGSVGGGMSGLTGMFGSMMQSWMGMLSSFMSGGGSLASSLFGMLKSAMDSFFSIFNGLSGQAQGSIGSMYVQTAKTFNAVMKLKLNPDKHHDTIKKEMTSVKKIFETDFAHPTHFHQALKAKAPQLTTTVKLAFQRAKQEFNKHHSALHPEAKEGVQKMHLQLVQAKFGIDSLMGPLGSIMSGMMGQGGGIMGTMASMFFNIIKNVLGMMTGLF